MYLRAGGCPVLDRWVHGRWTAGCVCSLSQLLGATCQHAADPGEGAFRNPGMACLPSPTFPRTPWRRPIPCLPLPCLRADVPPGCDIHASAHAFTSERGGACRPGGGQDWHHVAPGGRVGEAAAPQVLLFSRYLESALCQGPRGRHSMVRETRLGCWRKGHRPGTVWDGARPGLLSATGGIFQE